MAEMIEKGPPPGYCFCFCHSHACAGHLVTHNVFYLHSKEDKNKQKEQALLAQSMPINPTSSDEQVRELEQAVSRLVFTDVIASTQHTEENKVEEAQLGSDGVQGKLSIIYIRKNALTLNNPQKTS